MSTASTSQHSFRLSRRTMQLVDDAAASTDESRNALVDRLLGEAVRLERHPLVTFRRGGSGRRRPAIAGTRLDVHQVISTLREHDGDVASAADFFDLPALLVDAALSYYADFPDEVDALQAEEDAAAAAEHERWRRRQDALG